MKLKKIINHFLAGKLRCKKIQNQEIEVNPQLFPDYQKPEHKNYPGPSESLISAIFKRHLSFDEVLVMDRGEHILYDLALSFDKIHNLRSALDCLEIIPEGKRANKHHQKMANFYFKLGMYDQSKDAFSKIRTNILTRNGLRIYLLFKVDLLVSEHNTESAHRLLMDYYNNSYDPHHKVLFKIAEINFSKGNFNDAKYWYLKAFYASPQNEDSILHVLQYFHDTNQLQAMKYFCKLAQKIFPRSIRINLELLKVFWITNDEENLEQLCKYILDHKLFNRTMAEFVERIALHYPFGNNLRQGMVEAAIQYCEKYANYAALDRAWSLVALEQPELAEQYTSIYISENQHSPIAGVVRGISRFQMKDYKNAQSDLEYSLSINPSLLHPYIFLNQIYLRKPNGIELSQKLLEKREQVINRYQTTDFSGRKGFYDIEKFQLLCAKDDYIKAFHLKCHKTVSKFIEYHYPTKYTVFHNPSFKRTLQDSIFIIAEDGIGDEIRWSQYYPALKDHFKKVTITCEPRLVNLFRRSFPEYQFIPIHRRWAEIPFKYNDHREGLPHLDLARVLTPELFNRLGEYTEIRFTQEVTSAIWENNNPPGPKLDGAGHGPYLFPDSTRKQYWKNRLTNGFPEKLKVGLLWRSGLLTHKRRRQYVSLRDLQPLTDIPNIQYFSLQHHSFHEEELLCRDLNIVEFNEIDFHDDFDELSAFISNLDLVIGISTASMELAASLGIQTWILGSSPEVKLLRLSAINQTWDIYSKNTMVILPSLPGGFEEDSEKIIYSVIQNTYQKLSQFSLNSYSVSAPPVFGELD